MTEEYVQVGIYKSGNKVGQPRYKFVGVKDTRRNKQLKAGITTPCRDFSLPTGDGIPWE